MYPYEYSLLDVYFVQFDCLQILKILSLLFFLSRFQSAEDGHILCPKPLVSNYKLYAKYCLLYP